MLPNDLLPYHVDNSNLLRVGPNKDGGYIIHIQTIIYSNEIVTLGLSDNFYFEKEFLKHKKNCRVIAYDHTVDEFYFKKQALKNLKDLLLFKTLSLSKFKNVFKFFEYKNFFSQHNVHVKKKVGIGKDSIDLNKIFFDHKVVNCLLKIDIEGDEYQILDQVEKNSKYINTFIVELHNIDEIQNLDHIKKFINFSSKLRLIHIHGNNLSLGQDRQNNVKIIELTFVNIDFIKINDFKTNKSYPIINLDYPNLKGSFFNRKKDIKIIFN